MEHFKLNEDYAPSLFVTVSIAFLTIFTLGIPYFFAYEMWAEPTYWKNRWKLHRLLNQGKVKVKYNRSNGKIKSYDLDIEGVEYSAWIWNGKNMTLDKSNLEHNDYIGLFVGSITTKWLNHIAIKEIIGLANESEKSNNEPKFKSVDDFTVDDFREC